MNKVYTHLIESLNRDADIILAEEYPSDLIDMLVFDLPKNMQEMAHIVGMAWLSVNE